MGDVHGLLVYVAVSLMH